MGNQKNHHPGFSAQVEARLLPKEQKEKISLSLVIPVFNCSESIGTTLESIKRQAYESLEVIVIDAGSTDRTLEVVNEYAPLISRIYTLTNYNHPDMMNRGISLASSRYISFLFPGSFYISPFTLATFAQEVLQNSYPDLLYCGSIVRDIHRPPREVFSPFDLKEMQIGRTPATVPACWYRTDLFKSLGRFEPRYTLRTGFDFLCRVAHSDVRVVSIDRVFIDYDYGRFSYGKILNYAADTQRIIRHYFGFSKALVWFITVNPVAILKGVWHFVKRRIFSD